MVDEFREENGATRFVPGSHHWLSVPEGAMSDLRADRAGQVLACGPAGSLLQRGLGNCRFFPECAIGAVSGSFGR